MKQALMSIRMDADLKKEFDGFCAQVGLNSSVAVNMFVRTVLREKRIPFEITNQPSATTRAAIRDTERELETGGMKSYTNAEALLKDVLK
ncbi:type II toxin-antitoxin system RelB/DinJ family antitoxin [Acutalibacter caecimuris]|uniref:type II toxin-antitoxin system RelB/DinJ family antitoxin n=1 Tax=Acutalibacter caecimuris TaxID=3093657 RepID=UPI002AC97409|nr:type II toxin-antitoxin system RelB/DinJ family antitoxin [Acutalibacter sp. M00118]